jgi:class 3 adenylate cyclase
VVLADLPMFKIRPCSVWHSACVSAGSAGPPSGVVTFLFTDVEGSTRRWEADADAMRAALAAHDEVVRSAIQAHGGFLFKHTGDGVCAAFSSPRSGQRSKLSTLTSGVLRRGNPRIL